MTPDKNHSTTDTRDSGWEGGASHTTNADVEDKIQKGQGETLFLQVTACIVGLLHAPCGVLYSSTMCMYMYVYVYACVGYGT